MTSATVRSTACAVAVHLAAHRATGRAVHHWCSRHPEMLASAGIADRTSDAGLRSAVPGLEWRYDRGRELLRDHLTAGPRTIFSSAALLGAAYRHTGGRLFPDSHMGVAALVTAVRDVPVQVHLTVGGHAVTAVGAWVEAVRGGHLVTFEDFAATLDGPTWVPLVRRLVRGLGADRVVVHDATRDHPGADGSAAAATTVTRDVLRTLLDALGVSVDEVPGETAPPPDPEAWSLRQTEVALAILPHLRSRADRQAMRTFVQEKVDRGGSPAWPVSPALADDLAARDAADLARLSELVEVR